MQKKTKIIVGASVAGVILIAVMGIALVNIFLFIRLHREEDHTTLERIAYDQSGRKTMVYIREEGEYIPYMALESDYEGNVLLLRENLLPEEMQYQPAPYEDGISGLSGGWRSYDYGSYYEESSIDEFLNTDFLGTFSPEVQKAIVDTSIVVTDKASYYGQNLANVTHRIDRKIFLLSAVELDRGSDYCTAKEGTPLKYFENCSHSVIRAYKADGEAWPYWTRTPWLWGTNHVAVIGVEQNTSATPDRLLGVRPAFCMGKDTAVHKRDGIVEGKSVYVLDLEGE